MTIRTTVRWSPGRTSSSAKTVSSAGPRLRSGSRRALVRISGLRCRVLDRPPGCSATPGRRRDGQCARAECPLPDGQQRRHVGIREEIDFRPPRVGTVPTTVRRALTLGATGRAIGVGTPRHRPTIEPSGSWNCLRIEHTQGEDAALQLSEPAGRRSERVVVVPPPEQLDMTFVASPVRVNITPELDRSPTAGQLRGMMRRCRCSTWSPRRNGAAPNCSPSNWQRALGDCGFPGRVVAIAGAKAGTAISSIVVLDDPYSPSGLRRLRCARPRRRRPWSATAPVRSWAAPSATIGTWSRSSTAASAIPPCGRRRRSCAGCVWLCSCEGRRPSWRCGRGQRQRSSARSESRRHACARFPGGGGRAVPATNGAGGGTARGELGIDGTRLVAAIIGSLSVEKRPELAIEGALRAGAAVLVAGDGPLRAGLGRRWPGEDVRFLGILDDVRPVLDAADVVVLSSRTEGVPGRSSRGGAHGAPAGCHRVGGVNLIVDESTGRLVPADVTVEQLAEAIITVVADGD